MHIFCVDGLDYVSTPSIGAQSSLLDQSLYFRRTFRIPLSVVDTLSACCIVSQKVDSYQRHLDGAGGYIGPFRSHRKQTTACKSPVGWIDLGEDVLEEILQGCRISLQSVLEHP